VSLSDHPLDRRHELRRDAAAARLRARALLADLARTEAAVARSLDRLADDPSVPREDTERLRRAADHARKCSRRIVRYLAAGSPVLPPAPRTSGQCGG
jgi:hypothetical protein